MSVERTDLPSGLTVVTEAMAGARSASFGCWVRVGARDEAADLAGASHFLEHLLFKGTETRSGREISEAIEAVGGELNAHTSHEHTAFYARVPASAAAVGLELLTDVVTSPAFDEDDVESERQVILEELHLAEDEGDDRVLSLAHEVLWPDHPLGREVLGSFETIDALERDAIAAFFERHYHPSNLVLVAAGDVDHDAVVAAGERFPSRRAGERPVREAPGATPGGRSHALLRRPSEQAHLCFAARFAPTIRSLRARGGQPGLRRRPVEPPVPGDPRGAWAGVLGVLLGLGLLRRRLAGGLRRHRCGARRRRAQGRARPSRRARLRGRDRA
ncbi:MAG: pitrilysin family protein [Acidimicrobiales bacterium]